jgi:hypothetical protein
MRKDIERRLDKLEQNFSFESRFLCVLDTPENRALVAQGFLPDGSQTTAPPEAPSASRKGKGGAPRRRLGTRDIVVFLSEAEIAL